MKYLKKLIICIILIIIIAIIFFIIDYSRVKSQKTPIFCLNMDSMTYTDGGTKQYFGLGYKVIEYKKMSGYHGIHIGSYFLQYDENL